MFRVEVSPIEPERATATSFWPVTEAVIVVSDEGIKNVEAIDPMVTVGPLRSTCQARFGNDQPPDCVLGSGGSPVSVRSPLAPGVGPRLESHTEMRRDRTR